MAVTIRQVAEAANVSVATVSRALSNSNHPMSAETRQRIVELAQKMGYHPNQVARSLRTERSPIIGVICDDITSAFTTAIVRGIQDRLKADGYFCIIINTDWNPQNEQRAIQDLAGHSIEGIIFTETTHQFANQELNLDDKKYVFVHRLFPKDYAHSVVPDETYGGRLAVDHLIGLGHRRIGHIKGAPTYYSSEDRFQAYRAALQEAGIPFDEALVEIGNYDVENGYKAAQKLLDLPEPPTAIFAGNDLTALGTIYAAQDKGLRVPDDLAIVGYDDQQIASLARPTITTVTLPCFQMGQASAELLLSLLTKGETAQDEIKVKGELIIRESCGSGQKERSPNPKAPSRLERLEVIREQQKR